VQEHGDAEARTRTWDHLVNSEALYQLSYFGAGVRCRTHRIGLTFAAAIVRTPAVAPRTPTAHQPGFRHPFPPRARSTPMTGGGDELDRVVAAVRERTTPDADERALVERVVDEALDRVQEAAADLPVEADVVHVGSTARNTWLPGNRDVDVFLRVPTDADDAELEAYGLEVGHAALPNGEEVYADHPYVQGSIEGVAVDVVPCYRVDRAADARSPVDRTPFHTEYVQDRLTAELAADVRVAKQFLDAHGVYGSDLRTRGCSGYLTELLVLAHGSVAGLLAAATDWTPPVDYDPADSGRERFDAPLSVVDPTDPDRNVAAVVTAESVARIQHACRDLLADPRDPAFEPHERSPVTREELESRFDRRGTTPVALTGDRPEITDDQLYPQLRSSLDGLGAALDRRGFESLRGTILTDDDRIGLLLELAVAERPAVERHEGPPVHLAAHASSFRQRYAADPDCVGPFIDGDRYVVERPREFTTAAAFLRSDALADVGLGADCRDPLLAGEVLIGDAVAGLAERFRLQLRNYVDPRP
jgi:tRNA nucleotidyltransferase (CCA-adding enzyme)